MGVVKEVTIRFAANREQSQPIICGYLSVLTQAQIKAFPVEFWVVRVHYFKSTTVERYGFKHLSSIFKATSRKDTQ
jgi:hypothetical protein